jgi:hypothetical protein
MNVLKTGNNLFTGSRGWRLAGCLLASLLFFAGQSLASPEPTAFNPGIPSGQQQTHWAANCLWKEMLAHCGMTASSVFFIF